MKKQAMLALLAVLGGAGVLAYGQPGSGKPYDTRDPFVCKSTRDPAKGAPSPSQLNDYIRCKVEGIPSGLVLYENVKAQIGKSRPYSATTDSGAGDIDSSQPVYPIRGTYDAYNCWISRATQTTYPFMAGDIGKNCNVRKATPFEGLCYKTTFGDWSCPTRQSDFSLNGWTQNVPPPPK